MQNLIYQGLLSSDRLREKPARAPEQYADKQHEYFASVTHTFRQQYLKYASDYFEAEIQNWDNGGEWETFYIRMADVVRPTAAITRQFDNYKMIIPRDPEYAYLRQGTKIRAMGSYWLVYNPVNISGGDGASIVRRCNASWNYLDYYGNLMMEPIIVENPRANASTPDAEDSIPISRGYYNVVCQYNEFTKQANDNTRLILGSKSYQVTGYGNFFQEFTSDYESVRVLEFSIRVLTKNEEIDDMARHVAEGKNFRWEILVDGPSTIQSGQTARYTATSFRNGKAVDATADKPIDYIWSSSDANILYVNQDGEASARANGRAEVIAYLKQNGELAGKLAVTVESQTSGVRFLRQIPSSLSPYQSFSVTAAFYDNGSISSLAQVRWTLNGGDEGTYRAEIDGNTLTVRAFGYSRTPLRITAEYDGFTAEGTVILTGL